MRLSKQALGRLFWSRLSGGYNPVLMITTGVRLLCGVTGITVQKEVSVPHISSLWTFIKKKILSGLSESGGVGNASFATFSIGRVEGEAGAWGVLQCKSVILIWGCKYFPEENSLLTASAQIFFLQHFSHGTSSYGHTLWLQHRQTWKLLETIIAIDTGGFLKVLNFI